MADVDGVRVVHLNPPFGTKLFQFHVEIYETSGQSVENEPPLMDLNPTSRNPGSALGIAIQYCTHFVISSEVGIVPLFLEVCVSRRSCEWISLIQCML